MSLRPLFPPLVPPSPQATWSCVLVQSVALPSAPSGSNHQFTDSGSAISDGLLTLPYDGRFLVATGYDAGLGTAGVTGTNAVTVAVVDGNDHVDTTTASPTFAAGNNVRSAASTDGTHLLLVLPVLGLVVVGTRRTKQALKTS